MDTIWRKIKVIIKRKFQSHTTTTSSTTTTHKEEEEEEEEEEVVVVQTNDNNPKVYLNCGLINVLIQLPILLQDY